jgi:hypothetical protein
MFRGDLVRPLLSPGDWWFRLWSEPVHTSGSQLIETDKFYSGEFGIILEIRSMSIQRIDVRDRVAIYVQILTLRSLSGWTIIENLESVNE